MCEDEITIHTVGWSESEPEIRMLREAVFIEEQHVPEELEWDGLDPQCTHVLARNKDGEPIGTGRITEEGHIGRMAVLMPWRGHGVGDLLLTSLLALARERGLSQ